MCGADAQARSDATRRPRIPPALLRNEVPAEATLQTSEFPRVLPDTSFLVNHRARIPVRFGDKPPPTGSGRTAAPRARFTFFV